jgi:hypothetical protein
MAVGRSSHVSMGMRIHVQGDGLHSVVLRDHLVYSGSSIGTPLFSIRCCWV